MWDFFICLLPFLLFLFLLVMLLCRNPIHVAVEEGMRRLAWNMWIRICWVLGLPHTILQDTTGDQESEVKLICKPTALAEYVIQHCETLAHAFLTKWPMADPHLQILSNLIWPIEDNVQEHCGINFTRDHLLLQDGGIIALDWAIGFKDQKEQTKREHPSGGTVLGSHTTTVPIVILIPNALGKITQHLVSLCHVALQQGFHPVVFHRRGHGGCLLTTPRYQQFGDPSDLMQAVAYLRNRHPSSVLLAISEGSGSGLLLSYLGECGSSAHLLAAACISPVFHGQVWFETPLPWLYHKLALFYSKLQLSRYSTALNSVMDIEKIIGCQSLQDMEKLMFCSGRQQDNTKTATLDRAEDERSVSLAKPDWGSYWEHNEPLRDADEVTVPVLCLYSSDDPLLPPASTLPIALFQNSPYFFLALTTQGSHCGFMQVEPGGVGSWSHNAALEYFRVVADFFRVDQRRCVVGGLVGQGFRQRTGTIQLRRRRAVEVRRERSVSGPQIQLVQRQHSSLFMFEEEHETFTWNRSYTR